MEDPEQVGLDGTGSCPSGYGRVSYCFEHCIESLGSKNVVNFSASLRTVVSFSQGLGCMRLVNLVGCRSRSIEVD